MRTADRTQGIIDRLAGAENYDAIKWILQSGVTTNYTESVVDAKIKANCDFQGRAGLTAKVERVAVGKTCKWCQDVAGEYVYPNVPADVWRRHERCNCIIKYTAATGRVDTLQGSGSTWFITESTDPEAIKNRKNFIGVITEPKPADEIPPNRFAQKIGMDNYKTMQDMVAASDNEAVRVMWEKNVDGVRVASLNTKRAYADYQGIHIDIVGDVKGNSYESPFQVIFHESGHDIDRRNRGKGNGPGLFLSTTYEDEKFKKAIQEDVAAWVDEKAAILKPLFKAEDWPALVDLGVITPGEYEYFLENGRWSYWVNGGKPPKYKKAYAYKLVEKEITSYPLSARGDLSDIVEGATRAKVRGGIGHGVSYWSDSEALATEAFAEFTDSTLANPESLELLHKHLPNATKVYQEIVEVIANEL